jgi:integrase
LEQLSAPEQRSTVRRHHHLRESASSRRRYRQHTHVVLRKALRDAVKGAHGPKLLQRNPADDVARPRRERSEMRTWSAEELRAFLEQTKSEKKDRRYHAAYLVAVTTGLRRGELLGLRSEDVDLDSGSMSVRRARVAAGYEVNEGTPKNGRGRSIALDPGTVAVLKRWRKQQLEDRLAWGEAWTDTGLVFTREDGASVHPQLLSQAFERAVKRSGLPRIRFHASLMLAAGVHPKVRLCRNASVTRRSRSHSTRTRT